MGGKMKKGREERREGTGTMAHQLRALTLLPTNSGSTPSIHSMAQNHLLTPVPKIWPPQASGGEQIYSLEKHPHA